MQPAGGVSPFGVREGVEVGAAQGAGGEGVAFEGFAEGADGVSVGALGVEAVGEGGEGVDWGGRG